jgi:hypothetical protein
MDMKCQGCGELEAIEGEDMCPLCKSAFADDNKKISDLENNGHSHHCACRQVWGDGECECSALI